MASVRMEGVLPLTLEQTWRLLWLHYDEPTITAIHPWITASPTVRDEGKVTYAGLAFPRVRVLDRTLRLRRRETAVAWTGRVEPPRWFEYRFESVDGPAGTIRNTYRAGGSGTVVSTAAEVTAPGTPAFLARWFLRGLLARADREDLAYLARIDARPKGT